MRVAVSTEGTVDRVSINTTTARQWTAQSLGTVAPINPMGTRRGVWSYDVIARLAQVDVKQLHTPRDQSIPTLRSVESLPSTGYIKIVIIRNK